MKKLHISRFAGVIMAIFVIVMVSCDQSINVSAETLDSPTINCNAPYTPRFASSTTVTISSSTTGVSIYYTTDGTAPDASGTLYTNPAGDSGTGPFSISETAQVQAIVYKTSYNPSPVGEEFFYRAWTVKTSMSTARAGAAAIAANGNIYVFGGYNSGGYLNTVEEFTPAPGTSQGTWRTVANMSSARAFFPAALIQGKIYVFGGSNGVSVLSSVEEFTLPLNGTGPGSWAAMTALPTARRGASATVYNNKAYLTGGDVAVNDPTDIMLDIIPPYTTDEVISRIDEYTPANEPGTPWIAMTSLPNRRSFHSSVLFNNNMYIFGGYWDDPRMFSEAPMTNNASIYNPVSDSTGTGTSLSFPRAESTAAVHNNSIYIFGGNSQPASGYVLSNEILVFSSSAWQTEPAIFNIASARRQTCSAYIYSATTPLIYVIGGKTGASAYVSDVLAFAP